MLYIGIPTYNSTIHSATMISIMNLKEIMATFSIKIILDFEVGSLITRSRQNILKRFYNSKADYLLFIDADISGFEDYIVNLITFTENRIKSIFGLTYRKKHFIDLLNKNHKNNIFINDAESINNHYIKHAKANNIFNLNLHHSIEKTLEIAKKSDGFVKVKHLPTGCLLIPRETVTDLLKFYPKKQQFFNFFDPLVRDGEYLSEDFAFCHLIKTIGGGVFTNINFNIIHHQENNKFEGNYKDYLLSII